MNNLLFRFDHFAILCETIPVGLISAAVNFIAIRRAIATVDQSVLTEATQALQCDRLINIQGTVVAANNCNFPGNRIKNIATRCT
jgi:hypothetical protein